MAVNVCDPERPVPDTARVRVPLLTLLAVVAVVARVAKVAKVARVAKVAVPLKEAVIVPALKLPEASLATMALAVFKLVALDVTVKVALVA